MLVFVWQYKTKCFRFVPDLINYSMFCYKFEYKVIINFKKNKIMLHYFKIKTEICNSFRSFFLILAISIVFCSCVQTRKSSKAYKFPDIGVQIKKHRIKKGYSIKELANAVKMSEQTLRLIEKGQATPIYPKLIALQEFLDTELVISH